jgi:hypothetical protein
MSDPNTPEWPKRPSPEVQRFLKEQPPIPIPRRQPDVPNPRGAIALSLLGARVFSRGAP